MNNSKLLAPICFNRHTEFTCINIQCVSEVLLIATCVLPSGRFLGTFTDCSNVKTISGLRTLHWTLEFNMYALFVLIVRLDWSLPQAAHGFWSCSNRLYSWIFYYNKKRITFGFSCLVLLRGSITLLVNNQKR